MKKLFYAFLFAAASLMVSCGTPNEGNEPDPQPQEKPFYGFEMEAVQATAIGGDEYIFQMFSLNVEQTGIERFVSAQFTATNVTDGVIPEGTYQLVAGTISDDGAYIIGSFYANEAGEAPFMALITDAELEIKHTAKGIRATVWADGVNANDGSAINDIECRYEGAVTIYGNNLVVDNVADAFYCGLYEGVPYWVMQLYNPDNILVQLYINTNSEVFEEGIPTGKYPFNYTFEPGNADATYTTQNGMGGSLVLQLDEKGQNIIDIVDSIYGGYVDITNNGDGTYKIEILYYNGNYVPYKVSFDGTVNHQDESGSGSGGGEGELSQLSVSIESAQMLCLDGLNWYYIYLNDSTLGNYGLTLFFEVIGADEDVFATGLSTGVYTPSEDYGAQTFYPGYMEIEGNQIVESGGSLAITMPLDEEGTRGTYDVLSAGTLGITNNGNGTYKFDINVSGDSYNFVGTFEGTPEMFNYAEEAAAPRKVSAPYKSAIKPVSFKTDHSKAAFVSAPSIF